MNILFNLLLHLSGNKSLKRNTKRYQPPVFINSEFNSAGKLSSLDFGREFVWGAAASAFQTEGAWNIDGKSPSIWDSFSHRKGKVINNENADTATDFYFNYPADIGLLKEMNFNSFRFSLSWSRILTNGKDKVNQKGIDYYNRIIDTCLEKNIQPWVTLYHWDLPQTLEDKGGWTNREILNWFEDYSYTASMYFGDRVKNWMVLNEPMAFTSLGYLFGIHAPGKKGLKNFLPAVHHAALCQSVGGKTLRENIKNSNIGTTYSCSVVEPLNDNPKNQAAAKKIDVILNRLFIDPVLNLGYPTDDLPFLSKISKYIQPGDMEKLKFDFDYIGIQYYYRIVVEHSRIPPFYSKEVQPETRGALMNDMNFEVYPRGIYQMLRKYSEMPDIPKILITESGVCYRDFPNPDSIIKDKDRTDYHNQILWYALQAKKDGAPLEGYFAWSLTDNFEWKEGYHPRFGLIYVDYETQKRYIKNSGKWFKDFLGQTLKN